MAGKEPEIGPTARTVASNVERLRTARGWSYTELSEKLQSIANWTINPVGIRRIESKERRVTVDDLMALSVALGVSPVTLLYPDTANVIEKLDVTGLPTPENARVLWEWFSASMWAYWAIEHVGGFTAPSDFFRRAWPAWLVESVSKKSEMPDGAVMTGLDGYDALWRDAREKSRKQQLEQDIEALGGDD